MWCAKGSAFIVEPFAFQIDQDEPSRVGDDQEMKVLKEMNELPGFEYDL